MTVNGQSAILGNIFTFALNIQPIITTISPNIVSGSVANDFVVNGSQFSNNAFQPVVKIGDKNCRYIQHTDTSISCQSGALGHGVFSVRVFVPEIGGSEETQNSEIMSVLALESVSPSAGSVLGGTDIRITGENFGTDLSAVEVRMNDNECSVINVTNTQIKCRTEAFTKVVELHNDGIDESK